MPASDTTARTGRTAARRGQPPRRALLVVTLAFAAMLVSANLATPLYAVYAKQFGFSTAVLALIFAVYARRSPWRRGTCVTATHPSARQARRNAGPRDHCGRSLHGRQ